MSYEAIDQAVRVLNEALEADPGAMLALMNFGVTVNQTHDSLVKSHGEDIGSER